MFVQRPSNSGFGDFTNSSIAVFNYSSISLNVFRTFEFSVAPSLSHSERVSEGSTTPGLRGSGPRSLPESNDWNSPKSSI